MKTKFRALGQTLLAFLMILSMFIIYIPAPTIGAVTGEGYNMLRMNNFVPAGTSWFPTGSRGYNICAWVGDLSGRVYANQAPSGGDVYSEWRYALSSASSWTSLSAGSTSSYLEPGDYTVNAYLQKSYTGMGAGWYWGTLQVQKRYRSSVTVSQPDIGVGTVPSPSAASDNNATWDSSGNWNGKGNWYRKILMNGSGYQDVDSGTITPTVTYKNSSGQQVTAEQVSQTAGTYTVTYTWPETEHYHAASAFKQFRESQLVTVENLPTDKAYDGKTVTAPTLRFNGVELKDSNYVSSYNLTTFETSVRLTKPDGTIKTFTVKGPDAFYKLFTEGQDGVVVGRDIGTYELQFYIKDKENYNVGPQGYSRQHTTEWFYSGEGKYTWKVTQGSPNIELNFQGDYECEYDTYGSYNLPVPTAPTITNNTTDAFYSDLSNATVKWEKIDVSTNTVLETLTQTTPPQRSDNVQYSSNADGSWTPTYTSKTKLSVTFPEHGSYNSITLTKEFYVKRRNINQALTLGTTNYNATTAAYSVKQTPIVGNNGFNAMVKTKDGTENLWQKFFNEKDWVVFGGEYATEDDQGNPVSKVWGNNDLTQSNIKIFPNKANGKNVDGTAYSYKLGLYVAPGDTEDNAKTEAAKWSTWEFQSRLVKEGTFQVIGPSYTGKLTVPASITLYKKNVDQPVDLKVAFSMTADKGFTQVLEQLNVQVSATSANNTILKDANGYNTAQDETGASVADKTILPSKYKIEWPSAGDAAAVTFEEGKSNNITVANWTIKAGTTIGTYSWQTSKETVGKAYLINPRTFTRDEKWRLFSDKITFTVTTTPKYFFENFNTETTPDPDPNANG